MVFAEVGRASDRSRDSNKVASILRINIAWPSLGCSKRSTEYTAHITCCRGGGERRCYKGQRTAEPDDGPLYAGSPRLSRYFVVAVSRGYDPVATSTLSVTFGGVFRSKQKAPLLRPGL